jgi:hypothetical protein
VLGPWKKLLGDLATSMICNLFSLFEGSKQLKEGLSGAIGQRQLSICPNCGVSGATPVIGMGCLEIIPPHGQKSSSQYHTTEGSFIERRDVDEVSLRSRFGT